MIRGQPLARPARPLAEALTRRLDWQRNDRLGRMERLQDLFNTGGRYDPALILGQL